MIAYVEGAVAHKHPNELVVDTGGVGWSLSCSTQTVSAAPPVGARVRVFTRMIVREDSMELFGFSTPDERMLFDKLCLVSGIGPRTALAVLGTMSAGEFFRALASSDAAALARAPGVGKKTAQRIILELRDKIAPPDGMYDPQFVSAPASDSQREAVAGLVSLGYSPAEAQRAVERAISAKPDAVPGRTEDLILESLKRIS